MTVKVWLKKKQDRDVNAMLWFSSVKKRNGTAELHKKFQTQTKRKNSTFQIPGFCFRIHACQRSVCVCTCVNEIFLSTLTNSWKITMSRDFVKKHHNMHRPKLFDPLRCTRFESNSACLPTSFTYICFRVFFVAFSCFTSRTFLAWLN